MCSQMSLCFATPRGHPLAGDPVCRASQCGAGCRRGTGRQLCRGSGSPLMSVGLSLRSRGESATLAGHTGESQEQAIQGGPAGRLGNIGDQQARPQAAHEQPLSPSKECVHQRRATLLGIAACLALPSSAVPALAESPLANAPLSVAGLTEGGRSSTEGAASVSNEFLLAQEAEPGPRDLQEAEGAQGAAPEEPKARGLAPDTTITQRVYMDFSLCPTAVRLDRTLGDRSLICTDGEPLGRVVLGLYGNQVPVTVAHFLDMVTGRAGSSYKGSIIHRSLPGQYVMAGRQGAVERGEVKPPTELDRNPELVRAQAFLLGHERPGTLSLALSENDDDQDMRLDAGYRNVEFLITTGPGPATQLDSRNVVFGTVLEGMDVVRALASVPTYKPNEQIRQFNDLAVLLGDERAEKGRSRWNKPLRAIVISDCGVVPVSPPLLPPSLP